eukprot:4691342-Amphidinium_carterae.1
MSRKILPQWGRVEAGGTSRWLQTDECCKMQSKMRRAQRSCSPACPRQTSGCCRSPQRVAAWQASLRLGGALASLDDKEAAGKALQLAESLLQKDR